MISPHTTRAALLGALLLALLLIAGLGWLPGMETADRPSARPSPLRPAPTAEPLIPTPLPGYQATRPPQPALTALAADPLAPAPLPAFQVTPTLESTAVESAVQPSLPLQAPQVTANAEFPFGGSARGRVGVGFPVGHINNYDWGASLPGWWLVWRVDPNGARLSESQFAQMVRIRQDSFSPELPTVQQIAHAQPGALWLIGNEPDVVWQDNATPEQYAAAYGILFPAIKAADPTALIAIGGVSQPTPLRLAYLDRILAAYRTRFGAAMPVDVWNVHAFILREERGSWGADIPPGMAAETGALYEIADHDNMTIFKQQIVDFRQWMAERGFRDAPLIVSEYGVLMPESYGFPAGRVAEFLVASFDFFLTARDLEIGYPADDGRLVQAFCWYSAADTIYPTSNLFDPETRTITPVGEMFRAYVGALP